MSERPDVPPEAGFFSRTRRGESIVVLACLAIFAVTGIRFAWTTSPTFDEPGLIQSGYANLTTGATKSYTANLIFAQTWSALPLLLSRPVLPSEAELASVAPERREFGRLFLYHPANDWRSIVRPARLMNLLLGLALGLVIYGWSRQLSGPTGGVFSLAFYCLSPTVLANAPLATTDLAAALWFTLAVNRWWALLHRVAPATVLGCGIVTGLLAVTKFTVLVLGPVVAILVLVRFARRRDLEVLLPGRKGPREIVARGAQLGWICAGGIAVGVIAAGVVWLAYLPQMVWFPESTPAVAWETLPHTSGLARVADFFQRGRLLPEPFLRDLWLFAATTGGRRAYLMGEYATSGWWYFFPVAIACKTPLPFLLALGLAGVAAVRRTDRHALAPLLVLVVVFLGVAMTSELNIGLRHVLPVFPALFVLAGLPANGWPGRRVFRWIMPGLLLWSAAELWPVRSDYLAYFNVLGGGSKNGHRVLVDSSYEWGQDLPAVERWIAAHRQGAKAAAPVYFSYFGNADLGRYAIDATLLPQFFELRPEKSYELTPGFYLVSATMLHSVFGPLFGPWRASYEEAYQMLRPEMAGVRPGTTFTDPEARMRYALFDALRFNRLCSYLLRREPDARVSHGVLVFELTAEALETALQRPVPEATSRHQIPGTEHIPQAELDFLK